MNISNKNIHLTVGITKKVADLAVCMSIALPNISQHGLKILMCNSPDAILSSSLGYEQAALAFSIFESIRDKLSGSPLEIMKSKSSNIKCKALDGNLNIYWNCQATGSSLRKSLGLAVSCLAPIKMYSKWTENIKFLTGKGGSREVFNYVVSKMAAGLKKVQCVAVGKLNTTKAKLEDIVKVIANKMPKVELPSAKEIEAPKKHDCIHKMHPCVKASGIAAVIVADYIRSASNGMNVELHDNIVEIYNDTNWDSKKKQINDSGRIHDFIDRKYMRLEDNLPAILCYFAIVNGYTTTHTASKILHTKFKLADLTSMIKKALH